MVVVSAVGAVDGIWNMEEEVLPFDGAIGDTGGGIRQYRHVGGSTPGQTPAADPVKEFARRHPLMDNVQRPGIVDIPDSPWQAGQTESLRVRFAGRPVS